MEGGGRRATHDCMVAPAVGVPTTSSRRAWRRLESCRSTPPVHCRGPLFRSESLREGEREREEEDERRRERKRGREIEREKEIEIEIEGGSE